MANGYGGRRKGSGRKKGVKLPATITKEQAREALRQIVLQHMDKLVQAQLHNAQGLNHLMMRDPKTGKFERVAKDVDDPKMAEAQIDAALASNNAVWIYQKDPSIQAFTDLMNRALDKPIEQVQLSGELNIQTEVITKLEAARRRLAKK